MMRHTLARAFLALLLVSAAGLAAYRAVRPTPEPRETEPGETEPAIALPDALQGRAHSLLSVPDSPAESTFGLVGEVATAKNGRTFVLDVLEREVGVFGAAGERIALLGGPGPGPGEFLGPVALAVDDVKGGVYVLDERKQGIDEFDPARAEWRRTIPLDFHAADLCFVSGRLYVLGGREGFLLHEVSLKDGSVLRSFAPDEDSRNLLLRGYRSSGYLGCAQSGEIAFLPSLRPEVARFSAERGTLIGTASVPGYKAVRVRPVKNGMQFDVPGGGRSDYGSSILPLPGGDWLVQVGRLKPGTNSHHEFISIRSHLLSGRDGQIRPLPVQLPRVMAAGADVVYTAETSPYPAVRIVPNPLPELLP